MKVSGKLLALVVVALLFIFLVPLVPESISTPVGRSFDHHGGITEMRSFSVTSSAAYRLFTVGVVKADVPCQSGIVNETDTYLDFGSSCGETYSWQW
jgi:hypothetical protein